MPAIPKRFYTGYPRRLRYPKNRIHGCDCCGTRYVGAPCKASKKGVVTHTTPEFCSHRCAALFEAWGI